MRRTALPLIFIAACLFACRPAPAAPPPATPTSAPRATPAPATPVTTVTPPADAQTTADPADAPPTPDILFDIPLDDRDVFATGLTAAGREALGELPGAPVYHMAITIDPSMSAVEGRQVVAFTNLEDVALDDVYFHLHPVTLDGAIRVSNVSVDGAPVEAAAEAAVLRVPLPLPLPPGESATIAMDFANTVPTDIGRNYGVLAYYDDILALAHFYPMLAVYDGEGWNTAAPDIQGDLTYSDAGFFLVRVTAPADTVLVGSGAVVAQEEGGGTQTTTFAAGPARDFYLAAGDFEVVTGTVGETTINSYAPADLADGAALALDVATAALAEHSERLSPYPYTELDIVTTPTSALGIEYPGLIVGTLRMYDVDAATQSGVPYAAILESTTAHEVAHQWFYNLVGNDQLDEPWLDEAVGSYSTYRYYVSRYGQAAADNYFDTFDGRWQRVERTEIPIGLPVSSYEGDAYGAIVYGRGPIFVRRLEETMGRETFDVFLRDYVRQFQWKEADTAAFRALAETHCDCDLGSLFTAWVNE